MTWVMKIQLGKFIKFSYSSLKLEKFIYSFCRLLESEFLPDQEFAEGGGPAAIRDLETPKHLRIEEEEPETWTQTVRTETISSLSTADIKRQEHIYEFILTESNHCQVLKVIQKIFIEGMFKYLSLPKEIVDRIFPYIETLIELHFKFLDDLRTRQNQVRKIT